MGTQNRRCGLVVWIVALVSLWTVPVVAKGRSFSVEVYPLGAEVLSRHFSWMLQARLGFDLGLRWHLTGGFGGTIAAESVYTDEYGPARPEGRELFFGGGGAIILSKSVSRGACGSVLNGFVSSRPCKGTSHHLLDLGAVMHRKSLRDDSFAQEAGRDFRDLIAHAGYSYMRSPDDVFALANNRFYGHVLVGRKDRREYFEYFEGGSRRDEGIAVGGRVGVANALGRLEVGYYDGLLFGASIGFRY